MPPLAHRPWLPAAAADRVASVAAPLRSMGGSAILAELDRLVEENRQIHEVETINLNPATNVMNPRAEAMLSASLGSRASLGYPGAKYEMGLEAIEQIEVIANDLVSNVFSARYVETRVVSGAMANLYGFMTTCNPGDTIIAPPISIGGHATHQTVGAAGLYRLTILPAPVDPQRYTIDVDALADLVAQAHPRLITVGASLNLWPHPVEQIAQIAHDADARVMFDAAHLCGMIAGKTWPNPLDQGADLMTMSTYKSLGDPPSGLIVTNDPGLAQRLEAIAYPGLSANFDAAKSAALAVTMLDWAAAGPAYAQMMVDVAVRLADELGRRGVPTYAADRGCTSSHQFAVAAGRLGGGQRLAQMLRGANILSCGIGLPLEEVEGDMNGLRLGTPEIVRGGMRPDDMSDLAGFITAARAPAAELAPLAREVTSWRSQFTELHYLAG